MKFKSYKIVIICLMIKNKFLARNFCKILFCNPYISQLHTFMRKGKDLDPDPYLLLRDPDADSGGPKTYGSRCESGTPL